MASVIFRMSDLNICIMICNRVDGKKLSIAKISVSDGEKAIRISVQFHVRTSMMFYQPVVSELPGQDVSCRT